MSMKYLISLLAFSFLIGCDGEKSNVAPSEGPIEEAASESKPPEAVSVNPNLKYKIEGDAVTITGCAEDASGELIIAAIIEGRTVTSIGNEAFKDCKSLTNITIGNGVTSIGDRAFISCTSLTSITIGNGVTTIGDFAFSYCNSLTAVTFLGDAPKIENDAFKQSSPTIYRKADAKGWGDTFAGRPVKLITEKP